MTHPVNVVFHEAHPHHPTVSPVVHCFYGGETLIRDLQRVVQESRTFGANEMALDLAIRWALEYGPYSVSLFNLETPELAESGDLAERYQLHLRFVRRNVEADPEWVLVDIAEFRAFSKAGVWQLDEQSQGASAVDRVVTGE